MSVGSEEYAFVLALTQRLRYELSKSTSASDQMTERRHRAVGVLGLGLGLV